MTTTNTMLAETVALLEDLSRRAAELAAALPSLDLDAGNINALAGEVQRINSMLADAEERIVGVGANCGQRSVGSQPETSPHESNINITHLNILWSAGARSGDFSLGG